jgi:hypothetical protein
MEVFLNGMNVSKRAHVSKSQMKTMPITLFNIRGNVHFEFIPQGQTVNQAYMETFSSYVKLCLEKSLYFGPTIGFSTMTILQLTRHSVKQFLAQKWITEMEHPPCFPNLALNDFLLFQKVNCA